MFTCKLNSILKTNFKIHRPKYIEDYMDFQFPPQNFQQLLFYDFKDLNEQLLRIGLKIGFYRGRIFQRKDYEKSTTKRLLYTCKQKVCSAKLSYLWIGQNQPLICQFFDNIHFHRLSNNPQKQKRQKVHQFILDMPYNQNWENYKKWMYQFDISDKDAKFIVEQLFWYNNTQNEIFSRMAFQGKTIRRIKDHQNTTICVFLATDSMKANYRSLGQVINFDTTTRMLKKPTPYLTRYSVGYFVAQDSNLRLAIVGICVFVEKEWQLVKQIFGYFFQLVCENRLPFVLFTQRSDALAEVVAQLKKQKGYTFLHLYDWYHITEQLKDRLQHENQPECIKQKLFSLFCDCLGESSLQLYNKKLIQLENLIKNKTILSDFIRNQSKYCLSHLPTSPINFGILYRYSRSLNQRINQCIVFETFKGRFFFTLLHFQKILLRLLNKVTVINQGLIKHIQFKQIHMLTMKLQNHIMELLLTYFENSLNQDLIINRYHTSNPLYYTISSRKQPNTHPQIHLYYSLTHNHWSCSCRIQYLTGLPCEHIIKIMREYNCGALEYYINTRWVHQKQDRIPEFSKPLISRKRRRV